MGNGHSMCHVRPAFDLGSIRAGQLFERDILKHDWTSWALKGFWQLFNSSSTPNPSTSSLFAQNNGSVENAPNVVPLPFTSSLQEKSIWLSNPTSTSISSKSNRKTRIHLCKLYYYYYLLFSNSVKTVKGKRDAKDSKKKSLVGIQDSGPSSSPSSKATWPIPASNTATNHYGDDEDWHGGDEQSEMTTTTLPTVAAAAPDTPPRPRHNQTPNPYVVGAKALIMADPKSVLMGNSLDGGFSFSWSSSSSLFSLSSSPTPSVSMIDRVAVVLGADALKGALEEIIRRLEGLEGEHDFDGDFGQGGADGGSSHHLDFVPQASSQTEEKRKWKEKESGDWMYLFRRVKRMNLLTDELTHAYHPGVISTTIPVKTDNVSSATPPPTTDELSNENHLGNITPSTL
ncbi:hypothetical protein BYT27DRAFT_7341769 [Phlegmacium glaucopus]|nr:hypothetical protein BYT27DRAFT_7341769 [Phlegmacium glaucopus]